jgi:hypothetical protein
MVKDNLKTNLAEYLKEYDGAYLSRTFEDWELDIIFNELQAKAGFEQIKKQYAKETLSRGQDRLSVEYLTNLISKVDSKHSTKNFAQFSIYHSANYDQQTREVI